MGRWDRTVIIKEEWQRAKKGEMPLGELVATIAPKLAKVFCPYQLLEDLKVAPDLDAFDVVWEKIYNWADANHVWIATF